MLSKFFNRRFFSRFLTMSFAGLVLAACNTTVGNLGNATRDSGQTVDPNATVKVALMVPRGTGNPNLEQLANDIVRSARLALAETPSVKIDLQVLSTGGNTDTARNLAVNAVNNGAKIIIGPLFAEAANAVGAAVAGSNVNVLSFSNNTEIAGGNVFVLGDTFENKANRIIGHASANGLRSISAIAPNNAEGEIITKAIEKAAGRARVKYNGTSTYDLSYEGVVAAMPKISKQILGTGSTAVILTANSDSGLQVIAELLPKSGVNPAQIKYLGVTRWDIPKTNLALPGLKGGWFTLPDVTAVRQFNLRFQNSYGAAPHPIGGLGYDGLSAVTKLLAAGKAGALTKRELTRSGGFRGSAGIFRLFTDGTNQRAAAVAEVTGSTFRVISGAPKSFAGGGS